MTPNSIFSKPMLPHYKYNSKEYRRIRNKISNQYHKNWKRNNGYEKKHYQKIRLLCFKKIQEELKCTRCGCADVRFLEINHKNGDGSKEPRGNRLFKSILETNRKDLELLCRPCNHIHFLEMRFGEKIPLRVVYEKQMGVICN